MSLIERFFGQPDSENPRPDELIANPAIESPVSLQLVFPDALDLDADALTQALRSYSPEMASARAELLETTEAPATDESAPGTIGLAGWGPHVVKLIGINGPLPAEVYDRCVQPAHFGPELKEEARGNRSHILLYYAGHETDALEQFVALAAVAAAVARFGALLVLNESAHTAIPTAALLPTEDGEDMLPQLRTLPIPFLYGGFVKIEAADVPGVWMRTFGCHLLGLPDFAMHTEGHHRGQQTFELFGNLLSYLRNSGAHFADGHTMQVGDDLYLRVRAPSEDEEFLENEGEMFVVETIQADQINRPGKNPPGKKKYS